MIERCAVHQAQSTWLAWLAELPTELRDQVVSRDRDTLPLERFRHVLDEEPPAPGSYYPLTP